MRRQVAVAASAAVLALGLAPGAVLGAPVLGTLDQSADFGSQTYQFDNTAGVSQTVTAGQSGLLTAVDLYCNGGGASVNMDVSIESFHSLATCQEDGWVTVNLLAIVTAGQQFTIVITGGGTPMGLGVAAANYAGGEATDNETGLSPEILGTPVADFAFRTYVWVASSTTYSWSPNSITAGANTTVTLTTETVFSELPILDVASAAGPIALAAPPEFYTMRLDALPAWFSPTGIACSAQIDPADCSVAQYLAGIHPAGDGTAMTVTIVITGTASPSAAGTGVASGAGCIAGPGEEDLCNPAQAGLVVVAAGQTPPPTNALPDPTTRGDAFPWWLGALPALLALAVVGLRRELRLARAGTR
jgi:hypothetical protein